MRPMPAGAPGRRPGTEHARLPESKKARVRGLFASCAGPADRLARCYFSAWWMRDSGTVLSSPGTEAM